MGRIGVQMVLNNHNDYDDREMYRREMRLAIEAEEMGYDTIWPVEHHFYDYSMCPDNLQFLSFVAARTEKLRLATAAIIVPWNNPMRIVEKVTLLDHLSEGRTVLGLGRGLSQREYRGFGIDMSEARDRFNEGAGIIVKGLEDGFVEADTQYYTQSRVEIRPRPFKSFADRRYMVCMSPESFGVAARLGLGAMMFSQMSWDKLVDGITAYREDFRTHNKGKEAPPISCADFVVCFPDRKTAEEVAYKNVVDYYWAVMEHYEMAGDHFAKTGKAYAHYAQAAEHLQQHGSDAIIEEYLAANLWGTPDMILEKLRERREFIGDFEVNGVFSYMSLPYDKVESCMRLFAKEVGPELKSWTTPASVDVATEARAAK